MSEAVAPSTSTVVYEDERYLSFPAIASAGGRLLVVFRVAAGNPMDGDAKLLICHSDDDGLSWSAPEAWVDEPDTDSRNCGGGPLPGGLAHLVYDMHHATADWRRTFYRTSEDGISWSEPIRLHADVPGRGDNQRTSIGNHGIAWDDGTLYFPHFYGNSVLVNAATGEQRQTHSLPLWEPTVARDRNGDLVMFSHSSVVCLSHDNGATWNAVTEVAGVSQPDLVALSDGRLLFCWSGKKRLDEWLAVTEDSYGLDSARHLKIFDGSDDGVLDSRGKAMVLEHGDEILTVLYEACGRRGNSRIHLVRTPMNCLI